MELTGGWVGGWVGGGGGGAIFFSKFDHFFPNQMTKF